MKFIRVQITSVAAIATLLTIAAGAGAALPATNSDEIPALKRDTLTCSECETRCHSACDGVAPPGNISCYGVCRNRACVGNGSGAYACLR